MSVELCGEKLVLFRKSDGKVGNAVGTDKGCCCCSHKRCMYQGMLLTDYIRPQITCGPLLLLKTVLAVNSLQHPGLPTFACACSGHNLSSCSVCKHHSPLLQMAF